MSILHSYPGTPHRQHADRVFSTSQWVPTSLDETFAFFADAMNYRRRVIGQLLGRG